MRIQRVVEIEHPGVDVGEGAGGCHPDITSCHARAGGHPVRRGAERINRRLGILDHPLSLWRKMTEGTLSAKVQAPSRDREAQRLAAARHVDRGKARDSEAAAAAVA